MKDFSRVSVLIFGAGGRQTLPVCEGFYRLKCRVTTYCKAKTDTGWLTRYKNDCILYDEKASNGLDFLQYGLKLIAEKHYDLVVPLGDAAAIFLSQHKDEIAPETKVAVNDWDVLQFAIDKARTMKVCAELGVPAPKTVFGEDIVEQIEQTDFSYPVVVKPRTGVGSIGFNIISSKERLLKYLQGYDGANGPLLVQEYVKQGKQPQYRADLFRTRDGQYKAALVGKVTRWYPLDGGSGIFVMSIRDDEIIDNCKRLLDAIGWVGYANIDMVFDEEAGKAKIIEINGRTGASIKIDYVSGVNISQLIMENELGYPVTDMSDYTAGKRITCFLPDMLWLLKSPDRFKADPSWFKRWGVKDVVFSWRDPLPSVGFLIESVRGYRGAMNKRQRVK